jgi:hypothetical protein
MSKNFKIYSGVALIIVVILFFAFQRQESSIKKESSNNVPGEPWKESQLMDPVKLSQQINTGQDKLIVINIGPSGLIKGAVDIGPTQDAENLDTLRDYLKNSAGGKDVVLYCGCCPFKNCPNIRPAFTLLNTLNYGNASLLDINENLKVDWIDKGFPME